MKVKCKVCGTTKVVKDAKLIPYKGKVISVSCANKNCSHRIKFKVPLDLGATQDKKEEPKNTTQVTVDKPETSKETFIVCPKCNASLPEETSFCTNCGHNLKEPIAENISKKTVKKYCKKCGHLLEPEAKFCLQCGEPVFPKVSIQETKETNEVPPKKQQEKPKASTHKKPESAVQKQAVPKKKVKQKSGVLGLIFKILLILVLLAVIGISILYFIFTHMDPTLKDGPWKTESYMETVLYSKSNRTTTKQRNNAVRKANLAYKSYLDSTAVTAPDNISFDINKEDFFINQFNPVKKGNLYFFTASDVATNTKMNVVLDLKSNTYFEAKAYFISDDEVSVGYIKGTLNE